MLTALLKAIGEVLAGTIAGLWSKIFPAKTADEEYLDAENKVGQESRAAVDSDLDKFVVRD